MRAEKGGRVSELVMVIEDEKEIRDLVRYNLERAGFRVTAKRYTSLPFEVFFQSTGRSRVIRMLDAVYHAAARAWPSMFAYQIIVEAEVAALEAPRGEGSLAAS